MVSYEDTPNSTSGELRSTENNLKKYPSQPYDILREMPQATNTESTLKLKKLELR